MGQLRRFPGYLEFSQRPARFPDLASAHRRIWEFDENQILGLKWRNRLPIEEILFFFVSSLLVAQSYMMLAPAVARILAAR